MEIAESPAGPALVQLSERQNPLLLTLDRDRQQAREGWKARALALPCFPCLRNLFLPGSLQYPERREPYLEYARHGLEFLAERMWDQQHGGFIELLARSNRADERWQPWKQMYGQAFGIFAAAGAYQATGDRKALQLAIEGFQWIERCAHDPQHGGYFELLTANGPPGGLGAHRRGRQRTLSPSSVGSVRNR